MSEMEIGYERRPITADEFYRMFEAGIFEPEERLELLDGELIRVPPMNEPHWRSMARLPRLLITRLDGVASVVVGLPLPISRISVPLPDFSVLVHREDFDFGGRATNEHALALIECSDSSLRYDRIRKLRAYAAAGIPEYWIVNLRDDVVEVYRDPDRERYATHFAVRRGDRVGFRALPEVTFDGAELLGTPAAT